MVGHDTAANQEGIVPYSDVRLEKSVTVIPDRRTIQSQRMAGPIHFHNIIVKQCKQIGLTPVAVRSCIINVPQQ